jgi:hypothetical protein
MLHRIFMPSLFAVALFAAPAFAITAQEKMKTCEFGADDQKLTGAARKTFISKCMANEDKPAAKKKQPAAAASPPPPPPAAPQQK